MLFNIGTNITQLIVIFPQQCGININHIYTPKHYNNILMYGKKKKSTTYKNEYILRKVDIYNSRCRCFYN